VLITSTILFVKDFLSFIIYLPFPLITILYLLLEFLNTKFDEKSFARIKYVLTENEVIFHSWSLFRGSQVDSIKLKNVEKISLEEYTDEIGTIYFMGFNLGPYRNTAHYPALLAVKNPKVLMLKIDELIAKVK